MPTVADDLAGILSTVSRPGDFFAAGRVDVLAPGIEVDGVGPIALPLLPVQAAQLVAAAERAPYGRGADTLVDTAVRRSWQIGAERVRIAGRHWPRTLEEIVGRATVGLGVDEPVAAELYKLLVYDEGSFFVGHRDTEKSPGMFATLVLALPSQSTGGELVVRHKGREVRLDLGCTDASEIAFAAFYADCVHEVLPITSGYRATLVFNLVRRDRRKLPQPPDYAGEAAAAAALLRRWADAAATESGDAPVKLIYPLEHAYTPAELGFAALKGADAAVAGVLAAAAPQAGCDLHLALLTIEESGFAEYDGFSGGRGRDPDLEAGEVEDRYETLSDWRRPDGAPSPLGQLPVDDGEICPPEALADMDPDEEHFHEATGNEGATFERTYRRAALVLWPTARLLAVVNQAGLRTTLPYLADLVARWEAGGGVSGSPLRAQAMELAGYMLATWAPGYSNPHAGQPIEAARMLSLLARIADREGADRLLAVLMARGGYAKHDNDAIVEALALFSPDEAAGYLRRIAEACAIDTPGHCAALLTRALRARFTDRPEALAEATEVLVAALPGDPALAPPDRFGGPRIAAIDVACVVDLVGVADAVGGTLARRTARHMLAWPGPFGIDNVLVPALRRLAKTGAAAAGEAFATLRDACLDHLRRRAAEPLEAPTDWSRPNQLGCACIHCGALARFLADPGTSTWYVKAAEDVRGHVEATIRAARSDVDTRTARSGRPYTLICTKNRASYERRAAQREMDVADIAALETVL